MRLIIPFVDNLKEESSIEELSLLANRLDKHKIINSPWPLYSYAPEVAFAIAYSDSFILLKYFVSEKNIRAAAGNSNEPVYKDSCAEFFISFGNDKEYYNLESNCIGTCLLGYGAERNNRTLASSETIKRITTQSVITSPIGSGENKKWELTLKIPFDVFSFHTFTTLKNMAGKANFYKCGDELPEPHYLAWNNIEASHPDFHLSEYFGSIQFA